MGNSKIGKKGKRKTHYYIYKRKERKKEGRWLSQANKENEILMRESAETCIPVFIGRPSHQVFTAPLR